MRMAGVVLLAVAAVAQDPPSETVEDLNKHAQEILQMEASVMVPGGMTLPMLFYMFVTHHEVKLECFVDPVAVPKIEDVKLKYPGEAPMEEVLKQALKDVKLVHFVWHGIVVITNEKGRKDIQEADWTGLTLKGLKEHPELSKKLNAVFTFKWDAYEPREALKEFAKVSGVAIKADALAKLEVKVEKRGMISPDRTTLWGALVCLARTTGITYEIAKDGSLIAKPPPKK